MSMPSSEQWDESEIGPEQWECDRREPIVIVNEFEAAQKDLLQHTSQTIDNPSREAIKQIDGYLKACAIAMIPLRNTLFFKEHSEPAQSEAALAAMAGNINGLMEVIEGLDPLRLRGLRPFKDVHLYHAAIIRGELDGFDTDKLPKLTIAAVDEEINDGSPPGPVELTTRLCDEYLDLLAALAESTLEFETIAEFIDKQAEIDELERTKAEGDRLADRLAKSLGARSLGSAKRSASAPTSRGGTPAEGPKTPKTPG